jgi:cyanophycin synthetase
MSGQPEMILPSLETTRVLHGANYFSAGPVVLLRIRLNDYHEVFTNSIPGFYEKLKEALPSLYNHHCSPGKPGGFFQRVITGTLLGHVIEHCAIEFQTLAGMDVAYGKTRSTLSQGTYHVIYRFFDKEAGIRAGHAAFDFVTALLKDESFDVSAVVEELIDIRERNLLGPGTQAIVDEAEKRQIPWIRLDEYNLIQLGTGRFQKRMRATIASDTSQIAVETADNTFLCLKMLADAGIPVPRCIRTNDPSEAADFLNLLKHPIVLKPSGGSRGERITLNISEPGSLLPAFNLAAQSGQDVLAQEFISGESYRILVVNGRSVAAARLSPPHITGDGIKTVRDLLAELNAQPLREKGDKGKLSLVVLDKQSLDILQGLGLHPDSVPPAGLRIRLKNSGNPSLGGYTEDVSEMVHPSTIFLAERAAAICGLNIAGVDLICHDIGAPLETQGGVVLEVNASPGLRMHLNPSSGKAIKVAGPILDMLFPGDEAVRAKIIAISGSRGATTCSRIINLGMHSAACKTGLANSEGLFIDQKCIGEGKHTNAASAGIVLRDPFIDCAILEVSLQSILDNGLGYPRADCGIILNVEDEAGAYDDLELPEDVAYAYSVVAEEVHEDGFTILNADDPLCYGMNKQLYSKLVLFSKTDTNPKIKQHILHGERAVLYKQGLVCFYSGGQTEQETELTLMPETRDLDGVLAAITALWLQGVPVNRITEAAAQALGHL